MTISKIDRETLRQINADVISALAAVQAKYGIQISAGKGQFTNGPSGNLKLEYRVMTTTGVAAVDPNTEWAISHYKLTKDEVVWSGRDGLWRVSGYSPRSSKYPILVSNREGKVYKLPLSMAQNIFGASTAILPAAPRVEAPVSTKPQREYASSF